MVGAGLRIAMRAEHAFEKLLAAGLTDLLGVQAFIIIGGVTRVVPLTGVTLPFVSYGGSSLVANYVLLALLLRISRRRRGSRPGEVGADEPPDPHASAAGSAVLLRLLFVQLNWLQVVKADDYNSQPAQHP